MVLEKKAKKGRRGENVRVLNLYAGIGGNRKLWEDVEVTAVEIGTGKGNGNGKTGVSLDPKTIAFREAAAEVAKRSASMKGFTFSDMDYGTIGQALFADFGATTIEDATAWLLEHGELVPDVGDGGELLGVLLKQREPAAA